jgi:hypothetical protein
LAALAALAALLAAGTGCPSDPAPAPDGARGEIGGALILSKAQFERVTGSDGKNRFVPGPAKMVILRQEGSEWTREVVEDPESNVFHKAEPVHLPGHEPGILTIGANAAPKPAQLKLWHRGEGGWTSETLAEATFGGDFNRFRDFEIGDVDADNRAEIVLATHDQGVVMILARKEGSWVPLEIDRYEDTFVHEIELGDVDRDGRMEIFATPSEPNRVDGTPQPGWIMRYDHGEAGYVPTEVTRLDTRHVKEILVTDVEGDGTLELYASIEATLSSQKGKPTPDEQLEIRRYHIEDPSSPAELVAALDDKQCRFLHAGDVDGDGEKELVATAYRSGIWVIQPREGAWMPTLVDADSSGYEHASTLADLDEDGMLEIYVAADDQGAVRRYVWNGEDFDREELMSLPTGDITFGISAWPEPPAGE